MQKHLSNEKITVYVSIENAIKMQFWFKKTIDYWKNN